MSKPAEKIVFEQRTKCPYCSKLIHTKVTRVTIKEAVKGETKIQGIVEKDPQTTLEADYQDDLAARKAAIKKSVRKHERR